VPTESLQDPGFFDSLSVGDLVKGAAGAAQLYSAYKAYKSGDYAGRWCARYWRSNNISNERSCWYVRLKQRQQRRWVVI
jgi:hypothetical protein